MRRPTGYTGARGGLGISWVRWHEMGWHTLFVGFVLCGIGVLFLAEMAAADEWQDRPGVRLEGHLQKVAVALPCLVLGVFARPSFLRRHAWQIYLASLALLVAVPLIGDERNNARRWIETPVFDLQPSEFAKLAIILVLARVLCRNRLQRASDWVPPLGLALVPMGLVVLQPDLGTAMTIIPVTLGMLYLAGARGWLLGTFLASLDVMVVTPAVPVMVNDLGGAGLYPWVFTAYIMAKVPMMPIYGRWSDRFGRRDTYLLGLTVFVLGSLLCALAPTMLGLIGGRLVQGLGGAALVILTVTIFGDLYPVAERTRMQGMFSLVWGVSSLLGPLAGGWLDAGLNCDLFFLGNIP